MIATRVVDYDYANIIETVNPFNPYDYHHDLYISSICLLCAEKIY